MLSIVLVAYLVAMLAANLITNRLRTGWAAMLITIACGVLLPLVLAASTVALVYAAAPPVSGDYVARAATNSLLVSAIAFPVHVFINRRRQRRFGV